MTESAEQAREQTYAMCVSNEGYEASLEIRKIYRVVSDSIAARRSLLRVVDESGEDYLYPQQLFVEVELPKEAAPVFSIGP